MATRPLALSPGAHAAAHRSGLSRRTLPEISAGREEFSSPLAGTSAIAVDGWEYIGTLDDADHSPECVAAFEEKVRQQATVPPERPGLPPAPPKQPRLSDAAIAWPRANGWWRDAGFMTADTEARRTVAGVLRGAAASKGVYRGPARLVLSEDGFERTPPGDVLVCPITTPARNVLFGSVGALVTNEGGVLSHPAIIAREFGNPAVVGTRTATSSIPDGAIVEVDGAAGTVRW